MRSFLLLAALVIFTSCGSLREKEPDQRVNHLVFCWLKEPGNKVQRAQLIKASMDFKKIPGVLEVRAGEVIKSDRSIVDSTYDVAISLSFNNIEDLKSYLVHKDHVATVKSILKPLVEKVLVYDFMEKI
jgi:hypothetical protein